MNPPLTILHTEASPGWGGQEIRILQESRWFARQGHRVFVLCARGGGIHERSAFQEIPNLSIHAVSFRRTLDPLDLLAVYRFIREKKVEVAHTHSSIDSWTASVAAKLAKVPLVRSRHVSIPVKDFFPKNLVYGFPDRIVTSGKMIADLMASLKTVSPDQLVSIPAGVDLERFRPGLDGSRIRREFGIPQDAFLAGKVAVIRGWKGHNDYIAAAERVLKKYPDAYFLIVGSGPGYDDIKKTIEEKKLRERIIMTGHREDIPEIMNALDVLVLASTSGEATSQVIPQAWACGKCVLATSAGGIGDIVRHGENGLLVPPRAPDKIAEGLIRLLEDRDLRNRLAENGFRYARENLSEEGMMQRTLTVYRELVYEKRETGKP